MPPDAPAGGDQARLLVAAAALGLDMTAPQAQQLLAYLALLQHWNRTHNLSAVRERSAMFTHHLLDSLAVVPALRLHLATCPAPHVLDVGSGGGLPGLVLAVMQPNWRLTCVDAVAKKCAFIRQAAGALGLHNLATVHARVERLATQQADLVISRAFASLVDFTALTASHLATAGVWAAMKGKPPADELAALPPEVAVFHVEQIVVPELDAQRCLVWIRPHKPRAGAGC